MPASGKSDAFIGSDFSYADLSQQDPEDFELKLLAPSVMVGSEDCWLIELKPRTPRMAEETGYVRAWVQVTNAGAQPSDPSLMIVEFQDSYHYAWAKDEKAVPGLQPGESQVFECFSMVPDEVKNVDGVQRTMNGDQVVCKFRSLTNPEHDDQAQIRKENRRGRKIEATPIRTSPLPTFKIGR